MTELDLIAGRGTAWLAAVERRVSRRAYDGSPVSEQTLDELGLTCSAISARFSEARVVLLTTPPAGLFTGVVGGYGSVKGAVHAMLIVADTQAPSAQRRAGWAGEAAILEATALGLDTCWVAGFFDPRVAAQATDLAPGERVFAATPVGHARESSTVAERGMRLMARAHARKPLDTIAPGSAGWPQWARAAVECARLAPSAMNRQPWRFRLDGGALVVSRDNAGEVPKVTKALDCGIATLHAELAAHRYGAPGSWIDLEGGLDVARYVTAAAS